MNTDRGWMYRKVGEKSLRLESYLKGVNEFLSFAFSHEEFVDHGRIQCPCSKCKFLKYQSREDVQMCLLRNGFTPNYRRWTRHGESSKDVETIDEDHEETQNWPMEMLVDAVGPNFEPPNDASKKFYDLFNAADEPLWEGCEEHTKLSAVTLLLHIKSEYGVTTTAFDAMLKAFAGMLPKTAKLPDSFYRCKALMKELGLPREKIHACENDCVLFREAYAELDVCPKCHESRYRNHDTMEDRKSKLKPKKVLLYFPLIPRLQRLYLSSKTAEHMRWHKEKRSDVFGELRHPADGEAWKDFDLKYPSFSKECRNIRLGLATDGFNPFGHSSKPHSTWPVFVVPYNLPPWMCMKEEYMFMSLLIPGPRGPGRELDIYLQPLIDELKIMWDVGIDTYDSSLNQNFKMRASLLWTISDFPALGMLRGWSTHGLLSCPICMDNSISFYLKNGRKPCYFGCHRRWLHHDHRWRKNKNKFNNKVEKRGAPKPKSGSEEFNIVSKLASITLGKGKSNVDKILGFGSTHNFCKKSIFFQLPYWSTLLLRHNLDVMHIEKNVFDNVFNTVMNVKGKTKDNLKARLDLQELGIKSELHPIEKNNGKVELPKAKYALTNDQVKKVCDWLKSLKVPDGYASNISRCVDSESSKISGLKSHDCHVLMERFLPIAFRDFLPQSIWEPLNSLSEFFRQICSKVYKVQELEKLETLIADTLCQLEMIFPPSFFDSMEHLPIHLAHEAKVGGPVQYRWMYPFERYMCSLKRKVRNRACPEGSIAESYLIDELVNFSSRYFDLKVKIQFNRPDRIYEGGEGEKVNRLSVFTNNGRPLGKGERGFLTEQEYNIACLYVLSNCHEVYPYINEHMSLLREFDADMSDADLEREHMSTFVSWFNKRVMDDDLVEADLKYLAMGPSKQIISYRLFNVNGFRFHSKDMESKRATQNSGVLVKGNSYNESETNYYGHLGRVVELVYLGKDNTVYLFDCVWYDVVKGVHVDKYGFTKVNTKSRLAGNDPFVLASQVSQVFYAKPVSGKNNDWSTVIITKARNTYDVVVNSDDVTFQEDQSSTPVFSANLENNDDLILVDSAHSREEVDPHVVEDEQDADAHVNYDIDDEPTIHDEEEESDSDKENSEDRIDESVDE